MKMKFKNWETDVVFVRYAEGGTAILLNDAETGERVARATVCLTGLDQNEVAIKDYSENEGMLSALIQAEIVTHPHRHIRSGYVEIPVCALKMKRGSERP